MSARQLPETLNAQSTIVLAIAALVISVGVGGAAVGVGPAAEIQTPGVFQTDQPETSVALEPESATVDEGETTTYDVVVSDANGGVGAYDFTVSIDDPSVASIAAVEVRGSPAEQTTDVSVAGDGSSADVAAALANTSDTGSVPIATVTVSGDAEGTSDIGLTVDALGTEAGESYVVTETTGASITVESDDPAPEPEPDPANFQVSDLNAPDSATQGDNITVSADVTNDGDEEATQTVQFRLDVDGNGTLEGDEALTSQEVTLDGDETQTVTFSDLDTSALAPGDYAHGVFTDDDSATATITIEAADDGDDGADDGDDGADDGDDGADDGDDGADDGDDGADDGDDGDAGDGDDGADDGDDGDGEADLETAVSLQPAESTVTVGETTTYDVVVDTANGGVGAYDFDITVDDPSVASVTDLEFGGDPSSATSNATFADDGSSVSVSAALANTSDTGSVTIATATVTGDAPGTSGLSLAVDALGTEEGESYTVTETTDASITVESDDAGDGDDGTDDGDDGADDGDDGADDGDDGADDGDDGDAGDGDDGTDDGDDGDAGDGDDGADDGGDGADDGDDGADDGDDGADDGDDGADDGDDGADDGDAGDGADEEFTLDEIAQAKYDRDFADLSTETAGEVQAIYNRQPFPDGTGPADIRTRDEIANDRYGHDFDDVSRETTIEIQNDYDAQFGPLPSDPAYTLDDIAQAKYGEDFANLSVETAGEVQAIYNRQPFPDGTGPADIRTRDEIANDRYGHDFDDVSRETTIEIQNDYDAQFGDSEA
jgi:hypothetical protein